MATIQKLLSNIFFFEGSLYKTLQIKVSFNLRVYSYFSNICQVRNIMCLYIILNDGDIHEEHFSYFPFQKTELLKTEQNWWITLMRCPWENVQVQTSLLILLYTCVICKLPLKHGMQTHFFRASFACSHSSSSFFFVVSSRFICQCFSCYKWLMNNNTMLKHA